MRGLKPVPIRMRHSGGGNTIAQDVAAELVCFSSHFNRREERGGFEF